MINSRFKIPEDIYNKEEWKEFLKFHKIGIRKYTDPVTGEVKRYFRRENRKECLWNAGLKRVFGRSSRDRLIEILF